MAIPSVLEWADVDADAGLVTLLVGDDRCFEVPNWQFTMSPAAARALAELLMLKADEAEPAEGLS